MDIEQALSQAELYIRQNLTAQARTTLEEILRDNPQNEEAWILSAQVSEKPEQVLYCLRQAIKINPASSRARLLLDRLHLPQTPGTAVLSSQPAAQNEPITKPRQELPPAVSRPDDVTSTSFSIPYSGLDGNTAVVHARIPGGATSPTKRLATQVTAPKRPNRWLQRVFTIAASACLLAPWILIQDSGGTSRTLSGVDVLLGPIFSPLGVDVGIASLALLASLVLPLLMFFRFKSRATQKWGERATIALAPLASVLCLDMISFFYAGLTSNVELRWGIWAGCGFYSLAGLTALINARRLGNVGRAELYTARAGWIFTWLFSFGDILAILVTMIGLVVMGKFSLFGIAIPFIWLFLGALLSHIA